MLQCFNVFHCNVYLRVIQIQEDYKENLFEEYELYFDCHLSSALDNVSLDESGLSSIDEDIETTITVTSVNHKTLDKK